MREVLNCILLVDDDEATNFLHQIVIEEHGSCRKVVCASNGKEALDILTTPIDGNYLSPELIFLDINMPGINGWEFLETYQKLSEEQRGDVVIVMLTTSLNPYDEKKASTIEEIHDFRNKPLTADILDEVIAQYVKAKEDA